MMSKSIKTLCIILSFYCVALCTVAAQADYSTPQAANRATALLCLEQAMSFSAQNNWQDAFDRSALGSLYDPEIADLWYVHALSASLLKKENAYVMRTLAYALSKKSWQRYNRDAARVMYADLLSDTLNWADSLALLDAQPSVTTADADYIRAKTLYRSGSIVRARELIKTAVSLYPSDGRFPLLFFEWERRQNADSAVLLFASSLVRQLPRWIADYPEIALSAVPFVPDLQERVRLIKSFNAKDLSNQLYPVLALQNGVIDGTVALEQVQALSEREVWDFNLLCEVLRQLANDAQRTAAQQWLSEFAGSLRFDVNGDGIFDLFANYTRGRTSFVRFDKNQDGLDEWTAECDFGVPIVITAVNRRIEYSAFPAVERVSIYSQNGTEVYDLQANAFLWTPVEMSAAIVSPLTTLFYVPRPATAVPEISRRTLVSRATQIQVPSDERLSALIRFTMLNGRPVTAVYTTNNQPYAYVRFENGVPLFRNVDGDLDSFYEQTEYFGYDSEHYLRYQTEEENARLNKMLFGSLDALSGIYISKVVADLNKNGMPDFEHTYLTEGGFSSAWSTAEDGVWDMRHTKRFIPASAQNPADSYIEETFFINPANGEHITVTHKDGKPFSVQTNRGKKTITKDSMYDLYWIGPSPGGSVAEKIVKTFNLFDGTAVYDILTLDSTRRVLAVSIGSVFYGEVFDE